MTHLMRRLSAAKNVINERPAFCVGSFPALLPIPCVHQSTDLLPDDSICANVSYGAHTHDRVQPVCAVLATYCELMLTACALSNVGQ